MERARWGPTLVVAVVGVVLGSVVPAASAAAPSRHRAHRRGVDARVLGTFAMSARVTAAVRVRGEHVGAVLQRTWTIVPAACRGNVCRRLELDRERGSGRYDRITLRRVGRGRYQGRGVFYVGLRCLGRTYPRGSRAPYRITLTVRSTTTVQGIRFARRITAGYDNPARSDATPCPLGPSHDAARYAGSAPAPTPPVPTFSTAIDAATDTGSFSDTSRPGVGGAAIVSSVWQFGDSASGAADESTLAAPSHRFSAPGTYAVTLTVRDAEGLSATTSQPVTAPGAPSASFTVAPAGATGTFAFTDTSTPGIGQAPIVAWSWNFGDPGSDAQDASTAEDPAHSFSAPGAYEVTLTATDANGLTSTTAMQVVSPAGA
ncbi:MAG: PKD domain-containing protein [Solirubrobacteraceae bacterium]|jgi:PKD repeat protein